jgi:dTDP-4-amino-4,6-dideoxy-D-glucose transaminase
MDSKPTFVTRPFLPPLEEFLPYLEQIWESRWLTNAGPFHERLETALAEYLGVEHLSLFTNGTIALVTALQALRITGEVITTPYSFVATAHSLLWNNIKPVFVDIDPLTCNLDPARIEAAITPQTTAILPVHCYGTPCDVREMQRLADVYGLKIIYDAAHAFGVNLDNQSLLRFGDLSVLSFHATKVFHTFEGGAIICPDAKTKQRIDYLKNFGFADEVTIVASGINGKMSEIQAAMGLAQLPHMAKLIEQRGRIDAIYRAELSVVPGLSLLGPRQESTANYSYFPIFVQPEFGVSRDQLYQRLRDEGVFARRYFYPLISDMPMYRGLASAAHSNLPQAVKLADRVLCLPIYPDLPEDEAKRITSIVAGCG